MAKNNAERQAIFRARTALCALWDRTHGYVDEGDQYEHKVARDRRASRLNEIGDQLQRPGDIPETGRKSETLQEELRSVLLWAVLLGLGTTPEDFVDVGVTTVDDLSRRLFYEYVRQNCPLLNPANGQFSKRWHAVPEGETFETGWRRVAGSDKAITQEMLDAARLKANADDPGEVPHIDRQREEQGL